MTKLQRFYDAPGTGIEIDDRGLELAEAALREMFIVSPRLISYPDVHRALVAIAAVRSLTKED